MNAADVVNTFKAAKAKRSQFLSAHGWRKSHDFPDRKPRWVKSFNGKELPLTSASAFVLERGLQ